MKRVTLGPFVLEHRIGQGGMAEVWRAVHEGDDVAVAVKVMTAERARLPRSHLQFRQEARAMARLDHPHIVRVHDAGAVPEQAARASDGALLPGMPYLVMDLLPGGSLWRYRGRLSWNDLRNLVTVLLDALAHAHGRGVVHRDLKPANVLLSPERRAVISDFGLAHLPGANDVVLRAGTPSYMAPEQFLDRWRDFGPWTDLYGFGCLVWTLVAGTPPFRRKTWEEMREAHLADDLPPLVPLQPMPEGLEPWLQGLLEKDPARRTQCAADAAWALENIDPDDLHGTDLLALVEPDDSLDTQILLPDPSTVTFGAEPAFAPSLAWSVGRNDAPPPPPADWRIPDQLHRLHLRGAGLGLLGARGMPTVGREDERDTLWRSLVAVHRLPLARAVVLEGAAGTGRSHLARWLAQRAQELGAATALFVEHGLRGGHASGLPGMLRAHLGTDGLDADETQSRVAEVTRSYGTVDPRDQRVLTEMVLEDEAATDEASTSTPERMAALSRHLCAVGARRPVVFVIDDAHRGIDALLFARWVLGRRETEPTPVLIVLVVQDEGLGRSAPARELLGQILACDGVERLRVHPLSDAELVALIRELVGIEGELARRVASRTGGNPAFALSLVEDWVARGVLERAEGGFRLRAGAEVHLPDEVHELWGRHLDFALSGFGERVWQALELAAVIGERVYTAEWQRICARAGLHPNLDSVDALVARRLVVSSHPSRSWRFVQGMVRESLLRRARDRHRLAVLHRWILEDLEVRPHVDDQRMARHLLGAGRVAEGVERLVRATRTIAAQGNPHGVLDLCDQAERALELASPELKARWRGPIDLLRGRALLLLGRLDEGESAAARVVAIARPGDAEHFEARTVLATIRMLRGDVEGSRDALLDLVAELRPAGLEAQLAHALRSLGITLHHLGDLDGALRVGMEARAVARDARGWATWAEATTQVAGSLLELGRVREAGRVADEGLSLRQQVHHPVAVASLVNVRAEVERRQGRFDEAVPLYEESLDILDRVGSLEAVLPRLNLATIHALQGRYGEAFRLAERCRRESALQRRAPIELSVRSVLLVAALGLKDRKAADEHATRILELAAGGVTCESDGYALIGLACRLLRERDEQALAERLSSVVVDWAYGRGRQHAQEIASLIGDR